MLAGYAYPPATNPRPRTHPAGPRVAGDYPPATRTPCPTGRRNRPAEGTQAATDHPTQYAGTTTPARVAPCSRGPATARLGQAAQDRAAYHPSDRTLSPDRPAERFALPRLPRLC